jgi:hypothetical protein
MALAVDGQGAIIALDASSVVRKLVGRKILWRRANSHGFSPGGGFDALQGWDIAGDSQGRVIEVGSWTRCDTGETCEPRVGGFVRVFDP